MGSKQKKTGQQILAEHCQGLLKGGQARLAEQLEISQNYLSLLRHGKRRPSLEVAIRLERVLGISQDLWI